MTLEVAVKADEFCLFFIDWWVTCSTKTEWASWVQAIAVTVTIIIPVLINLRRKCDAKSFSEEILSDVAGVAHLLDIAEAELSKVNGSTRLYEISDLLNELGRCYQPSEYHIKALSKLDDKLAFDVKTFFIKVNEEIDEELIKLADGDQLIVTSVAGLLTSRINALFINALGLKKRLEKFNSRPFWIY